MKKILTIGISTIFRNFGTLKKKLNTLDKKGCRCTENINFLVVIQGSPYNVIKNHKNTTFFYSSSIGLSKSRNIVLDASTTEYIWFLDDDVTLKQQFLQKVLKYLHLYKSDIFLGQIKCTDSHKPYKNYERPFKSIFWPLRTSSIEIIVRAKFLADNQIYFNTNLGLGTNFPTGEENNFLIDCKKKNPKIKHIEEPIVEHPFEDPQRVDRISKNINKIIIVRGFLCKKFGVFGVLIFFYWIIKFTIKYKKITTPYYMILGLFKSF